MQAWKELSFLYVAYDEFDNAAGVMMQHPDAWEHMAFKDVCVKCANVEVYYKALTFYLHDHPTQLNDLLTAGVVWAFVRPQGYTSASLSA